MKAASLTSALLARKGAASPVGGFALPPPAEPKASRPVAPGPVTLAFPVAPSEPAIRKAKSGCASAVPTPDRAASRAPALVASLQPCPDPAARMPGAAPPSTGGEPSEQSKLTLRVDRDMHLRLKLLAAHLHRSAQDIMLEALDEHLERIGPQIASNACACRGRLGIADPVECQNTESCGAAKPGDGLAIP